MADIDPKIATRDSAESTPSVTTGPIRGSRKVFVEGGANGAEGGVRVAMRAIDLEPSCGEPPLHVYDTSGPWGDPTFNANSSPQVEANPRYSGHDRRNATTIDRETNARSNNNTTTGAETITSFEDIPQAHAATARKGHLYCAEVGVPPSAGDARNSHNRRQQYSVNR